MMLRRLGAVQNFTLSAASQLSSPFSSQTYGLRLSHSSTDASLGGAFFVVADSTSVTASSTNATHLPSRWVMDVAVSPGQRLAVVEGSTAHGVFSITEFS
jgi:hypothetical protein